MKGKIFNALTTNRIKKNQKLLNIIKTALEIFPKSTF